MTSDTRINSIKTLSHFLRMPPSREALRHSGGEILRWISPTVTLYFVVELRRLIRPGTVQKVSKREQTLASGGWGRAEH